MRLFRQNIAELRVDCSGDQLTRWFGNNFFDYDQLPESFMFSIIQTYNKRENISF
ncbi:hypothetical protein Hanom_Chr07g00594751 [Helianthus anomalus]